MMKADPASSVMAATERGMPVTLAARPSRTSWLPFAAAIVVSMFLHELGHCTASWLHGYPAIPTPAEEYILEPLPEGVQNQMALGGIIGSVLALVAASFWLHVRPSAISSSILAGTLTPPGFYTLRFILAGRGHDATEFQEAQAALGLSYDGHGVDWLFVSLFAIMTVFWFWRTRTRPTLRFVVRLVVGAMIALLILVLLQSINNTVFDPLFELKSSQTGHQQPERRTRVQLEVASDSVGLVSLPARCHALYTEAVEQMLHGNPQTCGSGLCSTLHRRHGHISADIDST
jgi:hypothetical protein